MTTPDSVGEMINAGDQTKVMQEIDRLSDADDWYGLLELSSRCRIASTERGKPLWGCAAHAEYRIALDASPQVAALVMDTELGPFALGPVPEVVASAHDFEEMLVHIPTRITPQWEMFVYECVARGDDVVAGGLDVDVAARLEADHEVPLVLSSWEPEYSAPKFRKDKVEVNRPALLSLRELSTSKIETGGNETGEDETISDPDSTSALYALVASWCSQSNGVARVVATESLQSAVHYVDPSAKDVVAVDAAAAVSAMVWAGADGGAHGKRNGLARGRALMRNALASLGDADLRDEEAFGRTLKEFSWFSWDVPRTGQGWSLALAAQDNVDQVAFAVFATDHRS